MFINIDKENLRVLHKHPDQKVVSMLSSLESPQVATLVTWCDSADGFATLTELELKLLIKNSNGPDVTRMYSHLALALVMTQLCDKMPLNDVKKYELDVQLRSVKEGDEQPYRYVKGAYLPRLDAGLAEFAGLQYSGAAISAPASAPQPAPHSNVAAPAANPTGDDFTAPKAGTSTHTIFTYCATQWKESGYQESKSTLDNIRKKAVDVLVAQGLNISTVRTQAARWYQHRKQFVV